jgi:hypothetical protein
VGGSRGSASLRSNQVRRSRPDLYRGQTITIDYPSADGHGERFAALAADCLQYKGDIIVVKTTPGAAAKNAARTILIILHPLGTLSPLGLSRASPDLGEMSPDRRRYLPGFLQIFSSY